MAKLSAAAHRRAATIPAKPGYPEGRFPIPDKGHASQALRMLGRAKGLSSGQKAMIRAAAKRRLGQ